MIANSDESNRLPGDTCETVRVWLENGDWYQIRFWKPLEFINCFQNSINDCCSLLNIKLHHRLTNLRIVNLFQLDLTSWLNLIKVGYHAIKEYCQPSRQPSELPNTRLYWVVWSPNLRPCRGTILAPKAKGWRPEVSIQKSRKICVCTMSVGWDC